jgi:lipoate-protein ligase B
LTVVLTGVGFGVARGVGRRVLCAEAETTKNKSKIDKTTKNLSVLINFPACSIDAKHPIIQHMRERLLEVRRLGKVAYSRALEIQKELEGQVIARRERDYLLLLEHPHTFTIGRRSKESGVLATAGVLSSLGVEVFETDRGGKVTYHGIGQIVGYPIISLSPDREDVHKYVRDLEEVLILTLGDFGIVAFRIEGLTGVHTAEGKVAAIGVHLKRWVTTHGFALNVNTDLSYYNWIIACEGEPVTSMDRLLGREVSLVEVEDRLAANFAEVFDELIVELQVPISAVCP